MRIENSARGHGITDAAMLHAVRMVFRIVRQADGVDIYIGADDSGRLLESRDGGCRERRPADRARHALERQVLPVPVKVVSDVGNEHEVVVEDELSVTEAAVVEVQDAGDLRAIGQTVEQIAADELELRRLVDQARANGKSWGQIAIALGVTRQAAHERFARS